MESLISVIFAIYLLLFAGLTVYHTTLEAQTDIISAWQAVDEREQMQRQSVLTPVTATVGSGGGSVRVTVRNDGQTRLADFDEWDFLFHYYDTGGDYRFDWYPYTAGSPGLNQWTVSGIYRDATTLAAEMYEPGILNPGEEAIFELQLSPSIGLTTTSMLAIGTDQGVTISAFVDR